MSIKFDFSGKLALVTGSTKGIGFEIAKELLAANCRVIVTARSGVEVRAEEQ